MRGRVERLLEGPARSMWVGTFHGIAHRLLRMHWDDAGLPQNFQILDADDQLRLVKRVMRARDLDEQKWPARQAVWFINHHKDEGRRAKDLPRHDADIYHATHLGVYEDYEELCAQGGLVDFAELPPAQPRTVAGTPGHPRTLPAALQAPLGRRVPGHQRHPVRVAARAGRQDRPRLGGGRRRPVHLRLARRQGGEHPELREGLRARRDRAPGAELPLHQHDSAHRQRADRQQHRAPRQEAVDGGRRRRPHPRLLRLQRSRRSALHRRPHPKLDTERRQRRRRGRAVPLQRPVAGHRGSLPASRHPLPHLRRPALLRARRGAQRPRLHAPHQPAPCGCRLRARRQHAAAGHRGEDRRGDSQHRAGERHLHVAGGEGRHRRRRLLRGAPRPWSARSSSSSTTWPPR